MLPGARRGASQGAVMTLDRRLMAVWLGTFSLLANVVGSGVLAAQVMFAHPLIDPATTARSGLGQWVGGFVATFGLVGTTLACLKARPQAVPIALGLYILAACWITSPTSFANPAVTVARGLSDTFTRIALADDAAFAGVQLVVAVPATEIFGWLQWDDADA